MQATTQTTTGHSLRPMLRHTALAIATAGLIAAALPAMAGPAGNATAARINLSSLQSQESHDRFIVKYRTGSTASSSASALQGSLARAAGSVAGGSPLTLQRLRRIGTGADVVRSNRKLDRLQAEILMRQIAADPNVEYVEVDQLMRPTWSPNDPYYATQQWHYFEGAGGIKAPQAWDMTQGSGVVVAVIDTGITSHADLNANILPGYDMIADAGKARDGNGRDNNPLDQGDWYRNYECGTNAGEWGNSSFHGTHVAGTIAAVSNNGIGVAGVAPQAKIVPVRVLGTCGGWVSDIADGIIWASGGSVSGAPANANPAKVLNLSLGGYGSCSSTYQNAINGAVSRGSTVVVAAGNNNADASNYNPANCANVVTVASTTREAYRSGFSNYGNLIDIAAPGSSIYSTINTGSTVPAAGGYGWMSGTSMATPHVAGVIALMQSRAGATPRTPAQIEALLKSTSRAFPYTPDRVIGPGMLNAQAAVNAITGGTTPPPTATVLTNGVTRSGAWASLNYELHYSLVVPAGASNLTFTTAGANGDADIFVKYGGLASPTSFVCKADGPSSNETCTIAAPQAGTYYLLVKAYAAFSDLSVTGRYTASSRLTYSNAGDYQVPDPGTVLSPITVSGRSGTAPSNATVSLDIRHPYRGDFTVDLIAPDNTVVNLHNYAGGSTDNLIGSYTVNLAGKPLNGNWYLRVHDAYAGDYGYINSWSINF